MPQLALAYSFWQGFDRLEKPVKAGVRKAVLKFQQLSIAELHADKGLHLESVTNSRDPRMRTIRVGDFWRGIVLAPDDGSDTFLLLNVVGHEDAYSWAAKRLYTVNSATLRLEVRDVEAIEQLTPSLEQLAQQAPTRLFERHSTRNCGTWASTTRCCGRPGPSPTGPSSPRSDRCCPKTSTRCLNTSPKVSPSRRSTGTWSPNAGRRTPPRTGRPAWPWPIANTPNRITLITEPDELAEILEKPFAAWRVFLHPSQRRVAYRATYAGPAQVSGGPGTGKTVVALHRVKHLLERSPDGRILLTTFTNALAAALRENLELLIGDKGRLDRVEVTTVNAYAHRTVRALAGRVPQLLTDAEERTVWRRVQRRLDLPWSELFLGQEHRQVVLAHRVRSREEYQQVSRRGRGTRLTAGQRDAVWSAVELFRKELAGRGTSTHLQICADAADLLGGADLDTYGFQHVVVDEAQDLHPAQWRVLRAAVRPGPDDLFVTGDPHQRIYDTGSPWARSASR